MPSPSPDRAKAQEALDLLTSSGGDNKAVCAQLQIGYRGLRFRLNTAERLGLKPSDGVENPKDPRQLTMRVKRLEDELRKASEKQLTHDAIKRRIIGLKEGAERAELPDWLLTPHGRDSAPGVPTIFLSDLHWGEVVHPSQINGVNRYNIEIAHRRMDTLANTATYLLEIISKKLEYPGIVVVLGGDMISGNIHDELSHSNEINTMPTVLDLFGKIASFLGQMADTFGKVVVPCVTGNHGRDTMKIWTKDRHHTSFDWLLYCILAKHFEKDARLQFLIPDGPDAYYRIYGHRYLLTHGDQFRGGDGMIGALGPLMRGTHKKSSRNAQIDMNFDTMICGHWHQYIHLSKLIVNGSLKGYDEYAYSNNFPFERPQQALWLTHPEHGITFRMPVYVERERSVPKMAWASVPAQLRKAA
jgi:hypothetical protein